MMPALGEYAFVVLASYGAAALLLGGLVVLSLWRASRMRRALAEAEARAGARRD